MFTFRPKLTLVSLLNLLACVAVSNAKPSFSGMQFPIGQPPDNPVARVSIQEVKQTARKSGLFRIALIPSIAAQGVQIHFARPEINALLEVSNTLKSITQIEPQELRQVEVFVMKEPTPRLFAEEVFLKRDVWTFKNLRYKPDAESSDTQSVAECQLVFGASTEGPLTMRGEKNAFTTLQKILSLKDPHQNPEPSPPKQPTEPTQ